MPTFALRRLFLGLAARYHVWHGRRAYRAGRLRAAGRHLSQALAAGHSSFSAYLLMGKVAYRERDMKCAMDCFRMARRADPARYALEGFPKDFIESLARQPVENARQHYRVIIEAAGGSGRPSRAIADERSPLRPLQARREAISPASSAAGQEPRAAGKLRDRAEQQRLASQPRLDPGAWADVDWDVEARKLFGE